MHRPGLAFCFPTTPERNNRTTCAVLLLCCCCCHHQVLAQLANTEGEVGPAELRGLLFGDFMIPGAEPAKYDEITDLKRMTEVVTEYLTEFNAGKLMGTAREGFQFPKFATIYSTEQ